VNMSATYKQDDWMLIDSYILTRAESNDHWYNAFSDEFDCVGFKTICTSSTCFYIISRYKRQMSSKFSEFRQLLSLNKSSLHILQVVIFHLIKGLLLY
jgi:hypothetical protein